MATTPDPRVGRAYRCTDGLIRWITGISTRKNYQVLWLREEDGVWMQGGTWPFAQWQDSEEVPAPQPGETYKRAGVFSGYRECTA